MYTVTTLWFDWDERKGRLNERKHGVPFREAMTTFDDANARIIRDPDESDDEERFILLGMSANLRLLVVCHCYREDESIVRIISARKATPVECRAYAEGLQ